MKYSCLLYTSSACRTLGHARSVVAVVADSLIDDGQMVDDLDSAFFLMGAVTHAGTATDTHSFAVLHGSSAKIFGAAANSNFGTDRQQFDDVVRANGSAFAAARAETFVDNRQSVFTHVHSTEGAGTGAVTKT